MPRQNSLTTALHIIATVWLLLAAQLCVVAHEADVEQHKVEIAELHVSESSQSVEFLLGEPPSNDVSNGLARALEIWQHSTLRKFDSFYSRHVSDPIFSRLNTYVITVSFQYFKSKLIRIFNPR